MKLKEYLKYLNEFVNNDPDTLEMEIIYSSDDEGNSYHKVINLPISCQIHDLDDYYMEMVGMEGNDYIAHEDLNAVCIN